MFNWFRKPAPAAIVETPRRGFFSTDITIDKKATKDASFFESFKKSIRKTVDDFVFNDGNGGEVAMDDGLLNNIRGAYTGQRGAIPELQFAWYASQGFIGYQVAAILAQNWLVDKACTMPAEDAARNWFDLTVNDGTALSPDMLGKIKEADETYELQKNIVEFVRKHFIFGIRVALFNIESPDPKYYEKPFNPDGIKPGSYRGISQIDPYWCVPELTNTDAVDPTSVNFYKPTFYQIGGKRIHVSHLVVIRNSELPDILKPTYLYGGIPLPQRIAERVYAAERTANEAPMMALTKRMTTLTTDMQKAMADQQAFESKLDTWSMWMNNYGIKAIGEDEKVEQFDTSLTDFNELIKGQYEISCAIAEVPFTKMMSTSPKGMNATGEYDEANYHERLKTIQTHKMTPFLKRHYLCLMRSEGLMKDGGSLTITWKPTDDPTAKELAEINHKNAQTDQLQVQAGAIDGQDVRNRLIADPNSGYNGLSAEAPPPPAEETDDQPGNKGNEG